MNKGSWLLGLALPLVLASTASTTFTATGPPPPRPQGPCDSSGAAGTPCIAAHSTTRALSATYRGPLYRVRRQSDGATLDIGVVSPTASPGADAGGYADAAAQDAFCANTICVITRIYDQAGKGNHLNQAPPGPLFPGPAKGGFDTQPIADMEAGLSSGYDANQNVADSTIDSWRFVTAVVSIGGENGNGSAGTFYEGVMTAGYPTDTTTDAVQANIVAARYDAQRVVLSRVMTFGPRSTQDVTATFTNTTGARASGPGITLTAGLSKAHEAGAAVALGAPTPGAPNRYQKTQKQVLWTRRSAPCR